LGAATGLGAGGGVSFLGAGVGAGLAGAGSDFATGFGVSFLTGAGADADAVFVGAPCFSRLTVTVPGLAALPPLEEASLGAMLTPLADEGWLGLFTTT